MATTTTRGRSVVPTAKPWLLRWIDDSAPSDRDRWIHGVKLLHAKTSTEVRALVPGDPIAWPLTRKQVADFVRGHDGDRSWLFGPEVPTL
jgi:hypothetical protein